MLFCCMIVLDSTRGRGGEGGKKNPLFVLNFARAIVLSNKTISRYCRDVDGRKCYKEIIIC